MDFANNTNALLQALEVIVAFLSILGFFGFIIGIIGVFFANSRRKGPFILLLVVSVVLIITCGFTTGLKFFGVRRY